VKITVCGKGGVGNKGVNYLPITLFELIASQPSFYPISDKL